MFLLIFIMFLLYLTYLLARNLNKWPWNLSFIRIEFFKALNFKQLQSYNQGLL